MAHWNNKSPFRQLGRFGKYGLVNALVRQPSGLIAQEETRNRARFPFPITTIKPIDSLPYPPQ